MEGFGVLPEIFFSSLEEQMQVEETEARVQFLDAQFSSFKQIQDLNSSIWSYEHAAAYCSSSLSDPNSSSYEQMNYAMEEEILADSFFQIDSSYQFESLIFPNESNSDEFTESSSVIERSLERKRKFQADEDDGSSKRKKRVKNPRRRKKGAGDEEEKNASLSTSGCGEEDDESNDSQASAVIQPNVKARSGRGAAADSQSLYAKKRRERINERLRILQNLVPNGTKVDISTMLEEAAQYVKLLQLQIKLLSSDELWMYAPLAYNGRNIGLDLMIP